MVACARRCAAVRYYVKDNISLVSVSAPEPIENHGIVGDLNTVALVALDGTVDFLCFPRFDSPSVFASLLDPERGGKFCIHPEFNGVRRRQLYLPDSNNLLTR